MHHRNPKANSAGVHQSTLIHVSGTQFQAHCFLQKYFTNTSQMIVVSRVRQTVCGCTVVLMYVTVFRQSG